MARTTHATQAAEISERTQPPIPVWAQFLGTFAVGWAGGFLFWRYYDRRTPTPPSGKLGGFNPTTLPLPPETVLLPSADALAWHRAALYSMRAQARWCALVGFFSSAERTLPRSWTVAQRNDYQFRMEAALQYLRTQVQAEACSSSMVSLDERRMSVDAFLGLLFEGTDSSVLQAYIEDVRSGTIPCTQPSWVQPCKRPSYTKQPHFAPRR